MNKTDRKLIKIIILVIAIPILALLTQIFLIRPIVALIVSGSPEYAYRSYVWGASDIRDYEKFPYRDIQNAPPVFQFKTAAAGGGFQSPAGFEDLLAKSGTTAFLIIKDDTLLYEKYFNGFQRDSWFTSFSVAKSFDSALIGIALSDRSIGSVNDPVIKYIPELAGRGLDALTIRNLLKMDCGVSYHESEGLDILGFQSDDSKTYYMPDLRGLALTIKPSREALGSCFHYNNYYPLLEGMILERTTGMSVSQYLQERIWKPLGMEYPATWSINRAGDGLEKMESGLNARAVDFAKFGRLYLNKGNWNGVQVVPEAWVIESTAPEPDEDRPQVGEVQLPKPEGYYQYHWWGTKRENGLYDFTAVGHLGQYIFVRPDKNLIIVRLGAETKTGVNWYLKFQELAAQLGG
jgi:CubicO group peptidase (beta-lactamase class C family)